MTFKYIFIVDDDEEDRELFLIAIKKIDTTIQLKEAANGLDALQKLKQLSTPPDIIFVDLNMPLMDGLSCITELKKDSRYNNIPIVVLTTSDNPKEKARAQSLGASCFLTKPSTVTMLTTRLKAVLANFGNC